MYVNVSGMTNIPNQGEIDFQLRNSIHAAVNNYNNSGSISIANGNSSISIGGSTISTATSMYREKKLISVVIKEITVEISYRESPMFIYTTSGSYPNSTPPDRVWKEIYGLKDGKMTLLEVVQGKHIQAYSVPESFLFDDDPDVKSPTGPKEE